jgi:hypothetical protein
MAIHLQGRRSQQHQYGEITKQEVETLDLEQSLFTATADDLYTTEQLDWHLEEMENSTSLTPRTNTRPNTEED